ncbi:TetR/AcrR family transcriptional regulator [Roseiflexus sp.]|uniref:TetR/AcrR family transcriptional regulator n=1 Tax=Roseiflexus sp. TaxID=2562120 RepID=UPI00398BB070
MQDTINEPAYGPTAARILATATRLFMQRGYSAVSINDIVQAADVTKPTLYYHFSDKEELFVLVAIHMLADMHRTMQRAIAGQPDTRSRLVALAQVLLHEPDSDTRMMRHQAREHLSPERQRRLANAFVRYMLDPLRNVMQQGLDDGELGGHSATDLAMLFLGLMEGFQRQTAPVEPERSHLYRDVSTDHFSAETLVDLFLYGTAVR